MGQSNTDFQMVAKTEFETCESLDGKRVAVQSREGTTGVLTARWFEQECPQARPNILIVPGSENRVAGLIADQLDAAPIDAQNTALLMEQQPGNSTLSTASPRARNCSPRSFMRAATGSRRTSRPSRISPRPTWTC
jgi:hypothetical protein